MKNLNEYLIINESSQLSSNNLGLSISDLETLENDLNQNFSGSLKVFYTFSKENNSGQQVSFSDSFSEADKKEIEHVYGHALEQLLKTNFTKSISASIENSLEEKIKVLDDSHIMINGEKIYIEYKSSSHDLNESGTTIKGRGIHINSKKQYEELQNGLLIFVSYELNKEYSGLKIKHIYVRTPNLIEVGKESGNRYPITKLMQLK